MDSDDDDRRRDKFARERDFRRDDDRRNDNGMKRAAPRRDDYGGVKRGRMDENEGRDDGVMMTFKKFLLSQDDDISDDVAVTKYNEYKVNFKRQQLTKFFTAHKDEEWFRQKYHPDDSEAVRSAHLENVKKRLDIFEKLREQGAFTDLALDLENAKDIIRVMDTVVVLLEGGTEEDVEALKKEKIEDESIEELEKSEEEVKNGDGTVSDADDAAAGKKKKTQLHKTQSVFLRNVPPTVTQEEIEEICKRSPGFLRVSLADAVPERKFVRRGWVTYRRDVNIKEICWNLNAIKIKDSEFNAIINRDLTRRIRTTNGITAHKQVAQNDLRMAVKLTAMLDKRIGIYGDDEQPLVDREKDIRMGVDLVGQSKNPLVKMAKNALLDVDADEISPEEEELLRRSGGDTKNAEEKSSFQREEAVLKTLDMLVLYLRVVHSIDFYGHLDYPNEDNMPSRCGIMHVRGQGPSGNQWGTSEDGKVLISNKFITDFTAGFNQRLEESLMDVSYVTDDEVEKLGKKDPEKSVEDFILVNSVELAKDKWLCPLSGKKFKGPEFIRKHLQSKHEDALTNVKKEAEFFNVYLADAKRPVDVEVKSAPAPPREEDRRDDRYGSDRSRGPPPPRYSGGGSRDYGSRSGGGRHFEDSRRDYRPQVSYRDLDAPEDIA